MCLGWRDRVVLAIFCPLLCMSLCLYCLFMYLLHDGREGGLKRMGKEGRGSNMSEFDTYKHTLYIHVYVSI